MRDSAKVRKFRKTAGLTQKEAAAWWGCTERAWQRYEGDQRRVPQPLLNEIDRIRAAGYNTGGIAFAAKPA